jgi:hypothetical protein
MPGTGSASVGRDLQVPAKAASAASPAESAAAASADLPSAAPASKLKAASAAATAGSQQQHGTTILTVLSVALNLDDWSLGMASDKISISVIVACRIGDDDGGAVISLKALQDSELQLKDIACESEPESESEPDVNVLTHVDVFEVDSGDDGDDAHNKMLWAFQIKRASGQQQHNVKCIRLAQRRAHGVWDLATSSQELLLALNEDALDSQQYFRSGMGQQYVLDDHALRGVEHGTRNLHHLTQVADQEVGDRCGGGPIALFVLRFMGITAKEKEILRRHPRADGGGGKIQFRHARQAGQAAEQASISGTTVHVQTRGKDSYRYPPCEICFDAARFGCIGEGTYAQRRHCKATGYLRWMDATVAEMRGHFSGEVTVGQQVDTIVKSCFAHIEERDKMQRSSDMASGSTHRKIVIPSDIRQAIESTQTIQIQSVDDPDGRHIMVDMSDTYDDDENRAVAVKWFVAKGVQFRRKNWKLTQNTKDTLATVSDCSTKVSQPTEWAFGRLKLPGLPALAWCVVVDLLSRFISKQDSSTTLQLNWSRLQLVARYKPKAAVHLHKGGPGSKAEAVPLDEHKYQEEFWVLVLIIVGVWREFSCYFKGTLHITDAPERHDQLIEAVTKTKERINALLSKLAEYGQHATNQSEANNGAVESDAAAAAAAPVAGSAADAVSVCRTLRAQEVTFCGTFELVKPTEQQKAVRLSTRREITSCNRTVLHVLLERLSTLNGCKESEWLTDILHMLPIMPEMQMMRSNKSKEERRGMPCTNGAVKATTIFHIVMDKAQSLRALATATSSAPSLPLLSLLLSLVSLPALPARFDVAGIFVGAMRDGTYHVERVADVKSFAELCDLLRHGDYTTQPPSSPSEPDEG